MIIYIIILAILIVYLITISKPEINRSAFPKIIFQTWKTHDLPKQFEYWSSTWKKYNSYDYILWDDAENRAFVAEHFDWFLPVYDGYDAGIKRADAIRYMFLYTYGGIYADLDFECLKSFDELLEKYEAYDIILGSMAAGHDASQWHLSNNIPNAIMISKPGCTFWLKVLKEMERRSKWVARPEVQTGPIVLKDVYKWAFGYSIKVLEPAALYPISWVLNDDERKVALASELTSLTQTMKAKYPDSYAITYWAHSW